MFWYSDRFRATNWLGQGRNEYEGLSLADPCSWNLLRAASSTCRSPTAAVTRAHEADRCPVWGRPDAAGRARRRAVPREAVERKAAGTNQGYAVAKFAHKMNL